MVLFQAVALLRFDLYTPKQGDDGLREVDRISQLECRRVGGSSARHNRLNSLVVNEFVFLVT